MLKRFFQHRYFAFTILSNFQHTLFFSDIGAYLFTQLEYSIFSWNYFIKK